MVEPKEAIKNIKSNIGEDLSCDWRLKLDQNENIYGASKFAISTVKTVAPEEVSFYCDFEKYSKKIAEIYNLNPQNCLALNSVEDGLGIVFNTYFEKGDKFLCYNPTSKKVELLAKISGAEIKYADYKNENFTPDIEDIKNNMEFGVKICYISTPNSITGQTLRASLIEMLLKEFQNVLFVVDVSYVNFAKDIDFRDYTDLVEEFSNLIIIKSYSNDYALAGLGFSLIVSNKENIENLKIIPKNNNIVCAKCAISAINDKNYIENVKTENFEAKELLYKGLLGLGYKAYKSDSNFILCDFKNYLEFYYTKLKNNKVLVKKFENNSPVSTCLRITVPKPSGVKYILELLKPKDLIVFAFENTLFDVENSYYKALLKTFEYFAKYKIEIFKIKNTKGICACSYFEALAKLLLDEGLNINLKDILKVFNGIFLGQNGFISKDELLIPEEILEKLSLKYDIALVCDRLKEEAIYSLKKFNIEKYFSFIKADSLEISDLIIKCPHKDLSLIVSNEEILSSAKKAYIKSIGLITKKTKDSSTINNFKHYGCDDFIFENKDILEYFKIEE